jgi:GDP-fucose protein O-fucosyltransferase
VNGNTKYLTYTPWQGGLNNTRMCFETALVLAYLSRRVLVTPKAYRRHDQPKWEAGEFRPLHPQECFKLETLNTIVDVLPYEKFDRHLATGQQADNIDLVLEPGTTVFCFPTIPGPNSPEASRLHDFAAGRQYFLEFTPQMKACRTLNLKSATLEQFYSFFYFSRKENELECKRLIRDHVKFRPKIIATAARIAACLGNYYALHVRRNDFLLQYAEQKITASRLLNNVMARVPTGTRLYIATDEPDKTFFSIFLNHYEIYFIFDFASTIPYDMSEASLACVEQMICTFAKRFMGTRLSTFSGYITRLRGYYGAPDKNIYFTDGFPGSEMDAQGSPPFSWMNWAQNGNPWWGREFKEAWEL